MLITDKVNIYDSILKSGAGFVESDTLAGTIALMDKWCSLPEQDRNAMRARTRDLFDSQFRAVYTAEDIVKVFENGVGHHELAA